MKALDITCRVCMAQPMQICVWLGYQGGGAEMSTSHPERIEDAAAMTRNADPVSKEDFDKAVEESMGGLL